MMLKSKPRSWEIFDRIAPRYDMLNRILSGGMDILWRKRVIKFLPLGRKLQVLDLATGTADLVIELCKLDRVVAVKGLDLSKEMLNFGNEKLNAHPNGSKAYLEVGDAGSIQYDNDLFDVVTMAFGIRNTPDPSQVLSEIYRVLKPDGKVIILEFSLPKNRLIRFFYLLYFRHVLPILAGILSGDHEAYVYLNQSVEAFPYGDAFCDLICQAGFSKVRQTRLTFGVATIYDASK